MTRRHGSVLILVSWILLLLATVAATLARTAHVEVEAADRLAGQVQARALAESGLERAVAFLKAEGPSSSGFQPPWRDDPASFDAAPLGPGTYTLYYYDLAAEERRYGIYEESSKLNLNLASLEMIEAIVATILDLSRLQPDFTASEIAAAIVDYRDEDTDPTEGGAEDEYYQFLLPPYAAKNGPFESLAELLMVRGIDERLLYGEDVNRNARLDRAEDDGEERFPSDDADGFLAPGLAHYFTLYSYDLNETAGGEARVHLLESGEEDLETALGPIIGSPKVEAIIRRRRQIQSVGDLVTVEELSEADIAAIVDLVTTTNDAELPGLVNCVTAPVEVLAVVPGLDYELARALVDARDGRTEELDTIGWTLEVIGPEAWRIAASFLTARSYQFEVASIGELHDGRVYSRLRSVVDLGADVPRILHQADETWLGPVLSASEREGGS